MICEVKTMVKIPGLDDLKKIRSDLIDSAKTVKLSGVVNKVKAGIESVSGKKTETEPVSADDPLKKLLQETNTTLNELAATESAQMSLIKKLQGQLNTLMKTAGNYQKRAPAAPEKPTEEDKNR